MDNLSDESKGEESILGTGNKIDKEFGDDKEDFYHAIVVDLIGRAPAILRDIFKLDTSYRVGNVTAGPIRSYNPLSIVARAEIEYSRGANSNRESGVARILEKYFRSRGDDLPGGFLHSYKGKPWERLFATHKFLELAEVPNVPVAYLVDERRIFLEQVAERTTEEELEKCGSSKTKRNNLLSKISEALVLFHTDATRKLEELPPDQEEMIFRTRNIEEAVVDYLRAIKGLRSVNELGEDFRREFVEAYQPVKDSLRKVPRVCHGEINLTNILVDEDGKIWFIGPRLRKMDPIQDAVNLLCCPGVNLYNNGDLKREWWSDFFANFRVKELEQQGAVPIRAIGFVTLPRVGISSAAKRETFKDAYCGAIHWPLRRLGKDADIRTYFGKELFEERPFASTSDEEMKGNIEHAIYVIAHKTEDVGMTQEEAGRIDRLGGLLREAGIFGAKDINTSNIEKLKNSEL